MILNCPECSAKYIVDPKALLPNGRMVRCAKCKHSWREAAPHEDIPLVDAAEAEGPVTPEQETPASDTTTNITSDTTESPTAQTPVDETASYEDEFAIKRARRKKRMRPMPKGSNLPALQNHKHGNMLWGWYSLAAFIVILVGSFLMFQSTISEIWPPSKILYKNLGMNNSAPARASQITEKQPAKISLATQFKIEHSVPHKIISDESVMLTVDGTITNLTDQTLPLPLLKIYVRDENGKTIREWTFKSSAAISAPDESVPFSTSLPNPPDNARSIRVVFAEN